MRAPAQSAAAKRLLDEEWSLVGPRSLGIPPSVAAMARARLDELSAELDLVAA